MHPATFFTVLATLASGSQALPQARGRVEARHECTKPTTPAPVPVPVPAPTNAVAEFHTMNRFGVCEGSSPITSLTAAKADGACVAFPTGGVFGVKMVALSSGCKLVFYGKPGCAGDGREAGNSGCYSEPGGLWGYKFVCPRPA
ncbi:hypothetical protein B0T25DRAFT_173199 [Lasiosphaeria hispida]|uniref:Uncharacterized protein n=1 Tax=Lasiosphaeria hispida TaxID=260671 RepID=A0AAJ0HNH9_9PEZI|nr:hypothetical protein B0T25DRAFT_173199 [Lasiosphaeria hispida]